MKNLKGEVEMEMIWVDDIRLEEFKKLRTFFFEIGQYIEKREKKEKPEFDSEAELDWMFPDSH